MQSVVFRSLLAPRLWLELRELHDLVDMGRGGVEPGCCSKRAPEPLRRSLGSPRIGDDPPGLAPVGPSQCVGDLMDCPMSCGDRTGCRDPIGRNHPLSCGHPVCCSHAMAWPQSLRPPRPHCRDRLRQGGAGASRGSMAPQFARGSPMAGARHRKCFEEPAPAWTLKARRLTRALCSDLVFGFARALRP